MHELNESHESGEMVCIRLRVSGEPSSPQRHEAQYCAASTSKYPKGLLDLPQELRDQIYEYIMIKPKNTITMLSIYDCFRSEVSAAQPALSRVNRQICSETLPMYYNSNTFLAEISDFGDLCIAKRWVSAIGGSNVRHLRHLALCGWTKLWFGHMARRLWLRVVFDLKDGTLEIEGNRTEVDLRQHLMKGVTDLKLACQNMVHARQGKPFDVESLRSLMDGFHGLCTAY